MNDWMNNPAMKNIDPIKLELIKTAASKTSGKSGKELAPIMMALISGANKQGIRFTPEEMTLILSLTPSSISHVTHALRFTHGVG